MFQQEKNPQLIDIFYNPQNKWKFFQSRATEKEKFAKSHERMNENEQENNFKFSLT